MKGSRGEEGKRGEPVKDRSSIFKTRLQDMFILVRPFFPSGTCIRVEPLPMDPRMLCTDNYVPTLTTEIHTLCRIIASHRSQKKLTRATRDDAWVFSAIGQFCPRSLKELHSTFNTVILETKLLYIPTYTTTYIYS